MFSISYPSSRLRFLFISYVGSFLPSNVVLWLVEEVNLDRGYLIPWFLCIFSLNEVWFWPLIWNITQCFNFDLRVISFVICCLFRYRKRMCVFLLFFNMKTINRINLIHLKNRKRWLMVHTITWRLFDPLDMLGHMMRIIHYHHWRIGFDCLLYFFQIVIRLVYVLFLKNWSRRVL